MLFVSSIFLAFVACVSAAPSRYNFDAVDYPYPYHLYPFGGAAAFAGAGFPWMVNPWVPNPFFTPAFRFPKFEFPTPWYEGPNVCQSEKVFEAPDEVNQWMNEGFPEDGNYQSESQQCRGNNDKYACMSRIQTNDGMKMKLTKWTCCFGFVRPIDGRPGCVESSGEQDTSSAGSVKTSMVKMNDQFKYRLYKDNSKGKSGVESVPAQ